MSTWNPCGQGTSIRSGSVHGGGLRTSGHDQQCRCQERRGQGSPLCAPAWRRRVRKVVAQRRDVLTKQLRRGVIVNVGQCGCHEDARPALLVVSGHDEVVHAVGVH